MEGGGGGGGGAVIQARYAFSDFSLWQLRCVVGNTRAEIATDIFTLAKKPLASCVFYRSAAEKGLVGYIVLQKQKMTLAC
jgi:hypothetical protein